MSEYSWPNDGTNGLAADVNTALLEADLLGLYGRFGIRVAAYWTTLVHTTTKLPIYNAMALLRNYDGAGGRVGSISVGAASSHSGIDAFGASASASAPTTVWLLLTNLTANDATGLSVAVQHFTPSGTAKVYRMVNGAAPAADTAVTVTAGKVTGFTLAKGSAALLVFGK